MAKTVTHPGDLYIPPLSLWLDPGRKKSLAFVSHAHADHTGRHDSIIASAATAGIMEHRINVKADRVPDYGEAVELGEGSITLHPAGHILGSSQALIELNGERIVYTGDFKLIPSRTAEPCTILPCDRLIMECTYGLPQYRFPDRAGVETNLLNFIGELQDKKMVPVVLAYALGRAQEIIKLLTGNDLVPALENRIFEMAEVYERLGVSLGRFEPFDPEDHEGRVLVFPPHLSNSPVLKNMPDSHLIAVTGWAIDGRQRGWYRSDSAFPISDHADFDDLIRYVEEAGPKKVYLIHGFDDFASHIKRMGIETEILSGMKP